MYNIGTLLAYGLYFCSLVLLLLLSHIYCYLCYEVLPYYCYFGFGQYFRGNLHNRENVAHVVTLPMLSPFSCEHPLLMSFQAFPFFIKDSFSYSLDWQERNSTPVYVEKILVYLRHFKKLCSPVFLKYVFTK